MTRAVIAGGLWLPFALVATAAQAQTAHAGGPIAPEGVIELYGFGYHPLTADESPLDSGTPAR